MKQVIKIRVLPAEAEAMALDATLRTRNAASSWLSEQMVASRIYRKFVHHRFYSELCKRLGLASQPTIRVIGKVADAYASLHAKTGGAGTYGPLGSNRVRRVELTPIVFRPFAAQQFDARCLSRSPTRRAAPRPNRSGPSPSG